MKIGKTIQKLTEKWARAEEWTPDLYDHLLEQDERLSADGYPRLSPFWKRTWKVFLRDAVKWLVAEVARRGGKGLNAAKLAVVFARHAKLTNLPPGERAYVQFLSVDRDEAANRLRMVEAMLDALGVSYDRRGDEIDLKDRPVTIRVSTASIRGTVGRTTILAVCDEVSRWQDGDRRANPAKEIIASLAPSMLTQPDAKGLILSAPFSENDYFAQRCEQRTNEHQLYVHAPTWIANLTITEEMTRAMEPDPATWSREYNAVAVAGVTSIASKEELHAVISPNVTKRPRPIGWRVLVTVDPGFVNDAFAASAWCRELRTGPNGRIVDTIVQLGILHLRPSFLAKVKLAEAMSALDQFMNEHGAEEAIGDFHYSEAIGPGMNERGKRYTVLPQTSPALTKRVENCRARIYEQSIVLLKHREGEAVRSRACTTVRRRELASTRRCSRQSKIRSCPSASAPRSGPCGAPATNATPRSERAPAGPGADSPRCARDERTRARSSRSRSAS